MNIFDLDTISESLQTLKRNKMRSFLTSFGIFWGVFIFVLLMGGGEGMRKLIYKSFQGIAQNSCFVSSGGRTSIAYKGFQSGRIWSLDEDDITILKEKVPGLDLISPVSNTSDVRVRYLNKYSMVSLRGILPNYARIEPSETIWGRYITDIDNDQYRKVCTIGYELYKKLFAKGENPCGKQLIIDNLSYTIIGVLKNESNSSIFGNPATAVSIPLKTYNLLSRKGNKIDAIACTVLPQYTVSGIQDQLLAQIKVNHDIAPDDEQAIFFFNFEQMFQVTANIFKGIKILIWLIGIGTVLGGTIGVSNIMMVTVRERMSEIGVRRAIGAKGKDIVQQVMLESMVMTMLAGLTGIYLSMIILQVADYFIQKNNPDITFQIPLSMALGVLGIFVCIGTLAGLPPSMKALSIKPIDAIRDE